MTPGSLYLLHIEPAYKHARHYLGFTTAPERRFDRHRAGRGSPLIKAALAAGCEVSVVAIWPGDRNEERRLKQIGSYGATHCPLCRPAYLARRKSRRALKTLAE